MPKLNSTPVTDEIKQAIISWYQEAGSSLIRVAFRATHELRIPQRITWEILKESGVVRRFGGANRIELAPALLEAAAARYEQGEPLMDVAVYLGVSDWVARRRLAELGVHIRKTGPTEVCDRLNIARTFTKNSRPEGSLRCRRCRVEQEAENFNTNGYCKECDRAKDAQCRARITSRVRDLPTEKKCSKCQEVKAQVEFFLNMNSRGSGLRSECRACYVDVGFARRLKKHGVTLEQFEGMYQRQKGLCAICEIPGDRVATRASKRTSLCIDHCHTTGRVRGLLCVRCNAAVGNVKEDLRIVERLRAYIEHECSTI